MAFLPPTQAEVPPQAAPPSRLDSAIVAEIAKSGLTQMHGKAMKLRLADNAELAAMGRKPVKAMAIPYFGINGQPTGYTRYRYLEDPRNTWERLVTKTKQPRYFQPPGTGLEPYFPPLHDWMKVATDPKQQVIITEGEKKAAAATMLGYPTIGLGGVDCFSTKKDDTPLLPALMGFVWKERDVVIIYDSDAAHNERVIAATVRLGRKLYALGASVRVATLQEGADGSKVGLDDFISSVIREGGEPKKAVAGLLATASAELFEREIALHAFNEQFIYIRDLDKILVRDDNTLLSYDSFCRYMASYTHREFVDKKGKDGSVTREVKVMYTAPEWMKWQHRLTALRISFEPQKLQFHDGCYNLWPGLAIEPKQGSVALWSELLDRLFKAEDKATRKWFEQWLAYPLQHPGTKLKTAALLWSRAEGTGKSTILEVMKSIYDRLYVGMNDSAVDLGYTDWLVNKLFVGVDDCAAKNRDDHAAKWKNLITANDLIVQQKYVAAYKINLYANFLLTSNEANSLRLSAFDRRYFVYETENWGKSKEDRAAWFNEFYAWLAKPDTPAALLHHFLNLDMEGFSPDAPAPMTEAKEAMQSASLGPMDQWVKDLLDAPDAMLRLGGQPLKGDLWTADDLAALYNAHPGTLQKVTRIGMGMALTNAGTAKAGFGKQIVLGSGLRARLFVMRNHDTWVGATARACAAHYTSTRGGGG